MTTLPEAVLAAERIVLPDRSGFLLLLPLEGPALQCPTCPPGRGALGLAILRQDIRTGTWAFACLVCAQ